MENIKALKYIFTEPKWWSKILIPGAVGLIPIVGFIYLLGWAAAFIRNLNQNIFPALPKPLSTEYFSEGVQLAFAFLVYQIPVGLFWFIKWGLTKLAVFLLPEKAENIFVSVFQWLYNGVNIIWILAFLLIIPILLSIFLREKSIRGTFDFRYVYRCAKSDFSKLLPLMAALCVLLTISTSGASFMVIGMAFTLPYALSVYACLFNASGVNY